MTTQEILASLSQLEQELQSIKSARLLAEDTVKSYREVQTEIRSFFKEFIAVTASLNTVAEAFDAGNVSLSNEVKNSIDVLKGQLETLNTAFSNQCNAVILHFVENANKTADDFKHHTSDLTADYATNNDNFKSSILELANVHSSIIKATESVTSLKTDIKILQQGIDSSQKDQDIAIAKIAEEIKATSAKHSEILSKICEDLKSSQDAQDAELSDIKKEQLANASKIDEVISLLRKESELLTSTKAVVQQVALGVDKKSTEIENRINALETLCKSTKTMVIINIVMAIVTIVAIFVSK